MSTLFVPPGLTRCVGSRRRSQECGAGHFQGHRLIQAFAVGERIAGDASSTAERNLFHGSSNAPPYWAHRRSQSHFLKLGVPETP